MAQESIETRVTRLEDHVQTLDEKAAELQKQQKNMTDLIQSVSAIAQKQQDMDTDLKEIKGDIKNIVLKPAKRWDSIAEKAILAAVGVLVAYVAVKIGLA